MVNRVAIVAQISKLCAWSLGLCLLCAPSAQAQLWLAEGSRLEASSFNLQVQRYDRPDIVLQQLAQANVVYLGETHDSLADHQAQLAIIQALHQRHPQLAIALEMFQRPYQAVLDRYLAGKLTETELQQQSQYEKRWGFPWENYAPILRYAKTYQIPLVALNTPTEVTRKVARQGWASLTLADKQFIPPISEIRTDNSAYRQLMRTIYDDIHGEMGNSQNFERFFLAQVLWDETMAERIAQFWQTTSQTQIVVLVGQGHVMYGYGIPDRVTRRLTSRSPKPHPTFQQKIVLLNPSDEVKTTEKATIADYFWYSMPPNQP
ncbi:MAG: ChaN family lipoprotein [Scytolyngbya sp. HA4215-MV1]|jgi:uncharacterized iron-regulated protein|nr:ChaN family lipoprotein [Scytolyngbya sp. HA4215-MV1]